jgi:two-component system, NarL family, nitrate/nitrite response regulator NarL
VTGCEGAGAGDTVERTEVTSVFIISEVRLYREGLERLLRGDSRLDVIGTATDVQDALRHLTELGPRLDAVLLDVPAPVGLRAPGQLESALPAARPRIVALNVPDSDEAAVIAWAEAGVSGLLEPGIDADELVQAVETTAQGGTVCSPKLAAVLLRRVARDAGDHRPPATALTAREREIAALIEQGLSNKEIAERLEIGLPTVKNHVHNILTKLKAARRGQAAAMLRDGH